MYAALWRLLPGPWWLKLFFLLVLIAAVLYGLFWFVFPWVSPLIDRELHAGDVEHENPHQTEEHEADHHRLEPHGVGCGFAFAARSFGFFSLAVACHSHSVPKSVISRGKARPEGWCPGLADRIWP